MNNDEQKKIIDNFKATFKKGLSKDGEKNFLEITFNDDLKKMLKEVCLDSTTKFNYILGNDDNQNYVRKELLRYKVKGIIFNGIYTEKKNFLFMKKLLDSGKVRIDFLEHRQLEETLRGLNESLQRALSVILSYDIIQTTTFKSE